MKAKENMTNVQALSSVAKAAKSEIKSLSIMYYVNQLNKLARKNEFLEGVNIAELGRELKKHTGEKDLFTAKCFKKDTAGRACLVTISKRMPKWGVDLIRTTPDGFTYLKPVQLSLTGLLSAYRAILAPVMRDLDKAAREKAKAEKAKANKAQTQARAELRKQQNEAIKAYRGGTMDIHALAEILRKTA